MIEDDGVQGVRFFFPFFLLLHQTCSAVMVIIIYDNGVIVINAMQHSKFFLFMCWVFLAERFDANLGGCKADKNQRKIERDGACMCALCNANARKQKIHKIIMKKKDP